MRLVGQIHEINVPIPDGELSASRIEAIEADFHAIYQQLYARRNLSLPIEVQNWRVSVSGPQPDLKLRELETESGAGAASDAATGTRRAYFPAAGFVETPVYDRYRLPAGAAFEGPAIVEEAEATTIARPGERVEVDGWGNLVVTLGG